MFSISFVVTADKTVCIVHTCAMHCIPAETTAIKKIKFCVYETGKIKTWNRLKDVDVLLVLTKIKAPLHYPGHKWAT